MSEVVRIEYHDETHMKVVCDPGVAYELNDYFTFDVPGAKFMPAYRNKMWDGKIRLFNVMSCLLYVGLIGYVEKFCSDRDYEFELDAPQYEPEEFSLKEANDFIEKLGPKMKPRDYQMDAFVHAVRSKRALLLSPTASGKSFIIYLIMRYYSAKTLIIVPTTSLVSQLASDFADYGFDSDANVHRIFGGQDKQTDRPVTISTWQSIYKLPKSYFDQFDVVIGDEAHLFKAKSMQSIMSKLTGCAFRFGFTGTLDGTQTHKLVLEGLFGPVRKVTTTAELIEKGTIAELTIKAIVLKYPDDIRKLMTKADYKNEMDYLVNCRARNKFIRNLVLSLEGNTLLLFQLVDKHGKVLYNDIKNEAGDRPVFFVSGAVDAEAREEIRRIVESEKSAIVVASYGTFSTGVNIRNLHNVVFASPSKSRVRNLQSIGRGLRKSETKSSVTLYDIADDLTWKSRKNFTLLHFVERVKIYNEEKFNYKVYSVGIKA
jgi:superfamily II DNA or RNA helicase